MHQARSIGSVLRDTRKHDGPITLQGALGGRTVANQWLCPQEAQTRTSLVNGAKQREEPLSSGSIGLRMRWAAKLLVTMTHATTAVDEQRCNQNDDDRPD
jgi:hypothetical protein